MERNCYLCSKINFYMKRFRRRKAIAKISVITSIITSLILFLFICIFLFWIKPIETIPYYVIKDNRIESILNKKEISKKDLLYLKSNLGHDFKNTANTLEHLSASGIVISPEQYASNISSYYNTLIAVLSFLLVILNVFGFFALRTNAESELQYRINNLESDINNKLAKVVEDKLLDSETVHNRVQTLLVSWLAENEVDDDAVSRVEDLEVKLCSITERLEQLEKSDAVTALSSGTITT